MNATVFAKHKLRYGRASERAFEKANPDTINNSGMRQRYRNSLLAEICTKVLCETASEVELSFIDKCSANSGHLGIKNHQHIAPCHSQKL